MGSANLLHQRQAHCCGIQLSDISGIEDCIAGLNTAWNVWRQYLDIQTIVELAHQPDLHRHTDWMAALPASRKMERA